MLINPTVVDVVILILLNCFLAFRLNDFLKTKIEPFLSQIISLVVIFHPFTFVNAFFENKFQLTIASILFIEHLVQNEEKMEAKAFCYLVLSSIFNLAFFPISLLYFFKNFQVLKKYSIYFLISTTIITLYLFSFAKTFNDDFSTFFVTYFNNLLVPNIINVFNYSYYDSRLNYSLFFLLISLLIILFNRQLKFFKPYGIYFFLSLPMIFFNNWQKSEYEFEFFLFNPYTLFPCQLFLAIYLIQLGKKYLSIFYLTFVVICTCFWLANAPSTSRLIDFSQNTLPTSSSLDALEVGKLKILSLKKEGKTKEAQKLIEDLAEQTQNPMIVRERLQEIFKLR